MITSMIQLPCSTHYGCMYHMHWDRTLPGESQKSNAVNTTTSGTENDKPKKSIVPYESPRQGLKARSLQCLPAELLLNIAHHLSALEQASLALTCRSFAYALGSEVWKKASKAGQASWYRHAEMLDVLQRDLESKQYWRCRDCQRFHLRSQVAPKDGSGSRLMPDLTIGRALNFRTKDESSLRIGSPDDPIYVLDFTLLKAIMDRHFLGAQHGVCLNTLRCQGKRTFPLSDTANMTLEYEFVPKIVLDRLLLQSTYKFAPQRTMFIRNVKVDEVSAQDFLERFGFWICGHSQACRQSRCSYCPTQSSFSLLPHTGLRIRVWQNFGSGRTPKDLKWLHMSRIGKQRKRYPWGRENIGEAFERILCSTKTEFERQLERSDGAGSWYDPELQKRAYKTLPVKLGERL